MANMVNKKGKLVLVRMPKPKAPIKIPRVKGLKNPFRININR